jgi:hypothetical protein
MSKQELTVRNKKLSIEIQTTIDLLTAIELLPVNRLYSQLVRQLIRCSTSIGINYRTAGSTKASGDFIKKLKKQEIDNGRTKEKLNILLTEANQLLSIYTPSRKKIGIKNNR